MCRSEITESSMNTKSVPEQAVYLFGCFSDKVVPDLALVRFPTHLSPLTRICLFS
jgi:hypothetical protein